MAFHSAAVKGFAVNSPYKIDKNGVTFFGFSCFCLFLVRLLAFAKFSNFFFEFCRSRFMCEACEFEFFRINRLEIRNRFNSELIFQVRFTFSNLFAIRAKVYLRLTRRTNFIIINGLLSRLIDGLFNNIFHNALTEHFTNMAYRHFTGAKAFK